MAPEDPARRRLDPQIEQSMKDWKVPGVALVVVEGDQVIRARGYGLRDPAKALPMTVDTRYSLASNTKAFTAMAAAILVDEGEVAWDTPVRQYLPELRLHDPYATDHLTPRDLLCHRSGLPAHDWSGFGTGPGEPLCPPVSPSWSRAATCARSSRTTTSCSCSPDTWSSAWRASATSSS